MIKYIELGNKEKIEKSEEIERKAKSRAILFNDSGKIAISNYGGTYLLPGGSIEKGENPNTAIIRELKEEIGADMVIEELEPLAKIKHFQSNYPKRNGSIKNRIITTYYYLGNLNKISENVKLTEKEQLAGFYTDFYSFEEIEKILKDSKNFNPRSEYFNEELKAITDYCKQRRITKIDYER